MDSPPKRSIKLSDKLLSRIKTYIETQQLTKSDLLFCNGKGNKPVSQPAFYKAFAKIVLFCFGDSYKSKSNPHTLRHSRAVHYLQFSNGDITKLQRILGHKSISNTVIYLRYANKDIDDTLFYLNNNLSF